MPCKIDKICPRPAEFSLRFFKSDRLLEEEIGAHKLAEEKLSELNRDFVSFLDNTSDFIYFKDENSRFRFCSQTLANITGHASWRDMIGKHDLEVFPQETAQIYHEEELPIFREGKPLLGKVNPFLDASGRKGWVSTNKWPLFDREGKVVGLFGISSDITEHQRMEDLLRKERDFTNAVLNTAGVLVVVIDREGSIVRLNRAAEQFTGYTFDEVKDRPFFWEQFLLPEQRHGVHAIFDGIKAGKITPYYENYWVSRDGGRRLFMWANTLMFDHEDQMDFLIAVGTDITERKQAEEKLRLSASVFTHAREGITITATDGTIISVNDSFTRITGYQRDEVLGRNPRLLKSGRQGKEFYAAMWRDLVEKGRWYGEIWNRRKGGEVYAEMLTISAVRDEQGSTQHYVALFSDITPLKTHEEQLERIAHYDALTSLPNRVLLADRLRQAMAQAQRHEQLLAVVYLDLDGFKAVNDTYGHEAGDLLLIAVASRMNQCLREIDTLSRLGGDEFVAVLLDLPDVADSEPMLVRLLAAAAQPVQVGDLILQVSASLGVTFYPQQDDMDADQLLRQADQAMYQAKVAGKNRYRFFAAERDSNPS